MTRQGPTSHNDIELQIGTPHSKVSRRTSVNLHPRRETTYANASFV